MMAGRLSDEEIAALAAYFNVTWNKGQNLREEIHHEAE